ncbi:hypothetical protein [Paracoccus litorisediminis]|uniref:Uncharacterized protein n=1 Tax=Paracoccus litorisediminis TaxID=2006130 RepID=A0A844HLG0_9RHOB|nr:hypothetical protein [Paracoccus litorisediminis]MTH61103.1 hypothetical protein [Paracoccus litorisediminis]
MTQTEAQFDANPLLDSFATRVARSQVEQGGQWGVLTDELIAIIHDTLKSTLGNGLLKKATIKNNIGKLKLPVAFRRGQRAFQTAVVVARAGELLYIGMPMDADYALIRKGLLRHCAPGFDAAFAKAKEDRPRRPPRKAPPAPVEEAVNAPTEAVVEEVVAATPPVRLQLVTPENVVVAPEADPEDFVSEDLATVSGLIRMHMKGTEAYHGTLTKNIVTVLGEDRITLRGKVALVSPVVFENLAMPSLRDPLFHIKARDSHHHMMLASGRIAPTTPMPTTQPFVALDVVQWLPVQSIISSAAHCAQEVEKLNSRVVVLEEQNAALRQSIHALTGLAAA